MWQRFSESARKAIFFAQEAAQKFGEGYVSTEHILIGLTREADTKAAKILEHFGLKLYQVRREVEKQLPQGDPKPVEDMSLTPRAKRVIDLAYEEARNLDHNHIGTEHLLLGLVREGDGLAGRVLDKLGVTLEGARAFVGGMPSKGAETFHGPNPRISDKLTPFADSVIGYARWEAEMYEGGTTMTPVHLWLGILRLEECAACRILVQLNVDVDALRDDIDARRCRLERPSRANVDIGGPIGRLIQRAKDLRGQRSATGTEHLVLALLLSTDWEETKLLNDKYGVEAVRFQEAMNEFYRQERGS